MEDNSCAQFADVSVYEGEEHVADLLAPEVGGIGREADTDCSVPGRLRGRQDVYRELGAEPYILQSKLFSVVFRLFSVLLENFSHLFRLQPSATATDWCLRRNLLLLT